MNELRAGANFKINSRPIGLILCLILIFLFLTAILSYYNAGKHADTAAKTEQTLNALRQLELLSSDLKDAETGQRGYLLTGKSSYLSPYHASLTAIKKDLQQLRNLADRDASMQAQIALLSTRINAKLDELRQTIELQSANNNTGALQIVNSDAGKKLMEEIRTILTEMNEHANKVLNQLNFESKTLATQTALSTGSLTFCIGASLLLLTYLILHQTDKQRAAEQAVRQSEERFQMLVSSVLDYAIIALDTDGNIVTWNEGAKRMKGYSADEIVGKHFSSFYSQEDLDAGKPTFGLNEASRLGRFEDLGWRIRKDGSRFYANVVITATRDSSGNLKGFSKVTRDITERKLNEDRLLQSKQELELLNKELSQARDQAQAASKFKSEFVANMSHEIRTPMNGIIGMCNILLKTKLDEAQEQYAHAIKTAANGLLTVINDILDFSKIEAGRIELDLNEFNLISLVEGVCEILAVQAKSKKLSLLCYVDPDLPQMLRGDSERLRQILINLASNAIKFSEAGEIVVRAEVDTTQSSFISVLFSISDSGIGLTESEQKKLFQPFVQADGSISRKFGGTGLGLSISKSLVELMGGSIGVNSTKGKGSTFWFKVALEPRNPSQKSNTHEDLKGVRVLIVDDEPNAREILHKYIISWGMRNGTASSADDAMKCLQEGVANQDPYQVAIVDLVMPAKNGIELAREVFQDPSLSGTNLILLTAFDTPGLGPQAIDLGFKAYVTKPVRQSQLLDCLTDVICHKDLSDRQPRLKDHGISSNEHGQYTRPELILVAEDHPINQKVAQLYLDELGFAIHIVNNGKEALKAVSTRTYDLVFMDCQMPEMDGLLATRLIRKRELRTGIHTPIIAMTAHAMKEDHDKCIAAGMDDFVSKPVDPARLREVIHKWLPVDPKAAAEDLPPEKIETKEGLIPPINIDSLRDKFGNFADEMIKLFVVDAPIQFAELHRAIEVQDAGTIENKTHTLKGVCATLGAVYMEDSCIAIEKAARDNDFQSVLDHLLQLETQFTSIQELLKEHHM